MNLLSLAIGYHSLLLGLLPPCGAGTVQVPPPPSPFYTCITVPNPLSLIGSFTQTMMDDLFKYFFNSIVSNLGYQITTILGMFQGWIAAMLGSLTWLDQDVSAAASGNSGSLGAQIDSFYTMFQPAGLLIVGAAAAMRIIRLSFDHKAPGTAIILDVLPRVGIGFLAIMFAADPVLHFAAKASWDIGHAMFVLIVGTRVSLAGTANIFVFYTLMALLGAIVGAALAATGIGLSIVIPVALLFLVTMIVAFIFILYLVVLWVGRAIIMLFCFASAPICIACAVYDPGNRFTKWWMNAMTNVLIMPVVLGFGAGVTFAATTIVAGIGWSSWPPTALSVGALGAAPFEFVVANVIMCAGIWYTGKVIRELIKDTYAHSSMFGAVASVVQMGEMMFVADRFMKGAGKVAQVAGGAGQAAKTAAVGATGGGPGGSGGTGTGGGANPLGNFYDQFGGAQGFQTFSQQNPQQASAMLSSYLSKEYGAPGAKGEQGPPGPKGEDATPDGSGFYANGMVVPSWAPDFKARTTPPWAPPTGEKSA